MSQSAFQWWGYKHINGSLQVKRYFEPLDIQEAEESPFVTETYGPFDATGREDALRIITEKIEQSK